MRVIVPQPARGSLLSVPQKGFGEHESNDERYQRLGEVHCASSFAGVEYNKHVPTGKGAAPGSQNQATTFSK